MSANLDDLRATARLTYRYWPIYLMLRLRELEQHLPPDQRPPLDFVDSDTAALWKLLRRGGLWTDAPPAITGPPSLPLDGDSVQFTLCDTEADARLVAVNGEQQVDVMRVPNAAAAALRTAADRLNGLTTDADAQTVLDAARLWAAAHGARTLNWQPTTTASPKSVPRGAAGAGAIACRIHFRPGRLRS